MFTGPAMFFLSDGEPIDSNHEWEASFGALTEYDRATGQGFACTERRAFRLKGADARILQR